MTLSDSNPVRDIHNAVANSADLGVASCRVRGTTPFELRLMTRDVLRKLELRPTHRILDVGCGVGVLGVPVAQRVDSYVGVDIADRAVAVLEGRLADAGLSRRAVVRVMDFGAATDEEIGSLGTFDRILAYAALHYVRNETEGERFVHRALELTKGGGRVLFGNLPLAEVGGGIWPPSNPGHRHGQGLGWALAPHVEAAGLSVPRRWRIGHVAYSHLKHHFDRSRSAGLHAPVSVPPGYALDLTRSMLEEWVRSASIGARYRWRLSAIGIPQYYSRFDLVVDRDQ